MKLTQDDVQNILRIIESSYLEIHLETSDFKLFVRKAGSPEQAALHGERRGLLNGESPPIAAIAAAPQGSGEPALASLLTPAQFGPEPAVSSSPAQPARALAANEYAVTAPMVGTFYRAPSPGAPPFVQTGDTVEPDTVVCIIEVMKLMNSIRAERRGRVTEILVENAQLVQAGQPLVVIEPAV